MSQIERFSLENKDQDGNGDEQLITIDTTTYGLSKSSTACKQAKVEIPLENTGRRSSPAVNQLPNEQSQPLEPLACTHLQDTDPKTIEAENSRHLVSLLVAKGLPDRNDERAYQTYRLSELGLERSQVAKLLDRLMPMLTRSKSEIYRKGYRDSLRGLIYALGAAGYAHEWLVLPMGNAHYGASARLGKLGLSRRRVEAILRILSADGLLICGRKGYINYGSPNQSKASQFYPSEKLMEIFASSLYEFEDDFEVDLYRYNDFPDGTEPTADQVADEVAVLKAYNDMMKGHSWARKGPTTRTFSENMGRGGRLNNGYQNIVNRRVSIRCNTFIDGEPLVEVDFSANHLRMLAALNGIELPRDPYATIAEKAGLDRATVKAFATVALGVKSRQGIGQAMKSLRDRKQNSVTKKQFHRIREAFETEYPWIVEKKVFFSDTGARMQVLEGNIAMRVIKEATRTGKPVLAVHDAFAVRERDAEWIEEIMKSAWMDELQTSIKPIVSS